MLCRRNTNKTLLHVNNFQNLGGYTNHISYEILSFRNLTNLINNKVIDNKLKFNKMLFSRNIEIHVKYN